MKCPPKMDHLLDMLRGGRGGFSTCHTYHPKDSEDSHPCSLHCCRSMMEQPNRANKGILTISVLACLEKINQSTTTNQQTNSRDIRRLSVSKSVTHHQQTLPQITWFACLPVEATYSAHLCLKHVCQVVINSLHLMYALLIIS